MKHTYMDAFGYVRVTIDKAAYDAFLHDRKRLKFLLDCCQITYWLDDDYDSDRYPDGIEIHNRRGVDKAMRIDNGEAPHES